MREATLFFPKMILITYFLDHGFVKYQLIFYPEELVIHDNQDGSQGMKIYSSAISTYINVIIIII